MSISFSGSTLTFSDSTTMTTAAVAGPPGPTGPAGSPSNVAGPTGSPGPTGPTGPTGSAIGALISTQSFSNAASVSFTGLSGYNRYTLMIENVQGNCHGCGLALQVGIGSTTWITSGYSQADIYSGNCSAVCRVSRQESYCRVCMYPGACFTTLACRSGGFSASLDFYNMNVNAGSGNRSGLTGTMQTISRTANRGGAGFIGSALGTCSNAKTAIKIYANYTNITGRATLYGWKES
jgi:hypothetical protein